MVQGEFGPDCLGCGGPDEGLGVPVGRGDVAVDGLFEVLDQAKHAALEALAGKRGEEALDGVQPGTPGRRDVE